MKPLVPWRRCRRMKAQFGQRKTAPSGAVFGSEDGLTASDGAPRSGGVRQVRPALGLGMCLRARSIEIRELDVLAHRLVAGRVLLAVVAFGFAVHFKFFRSWCSAAGVLGRGFV